MKIEDFLLYLAPLALCFLGYARRTYVRYSVEKHMRDLGQPYDPRETIGTVLGRALVSVIPVINIIALVFDLIPEIFPQVFRAARSVLNRPLVAEKTSPPAHGAGHEPISNK